MGAAATDAAADNKADNEADNEADNKVGNDAGQTSCQGLGEFEESKTFTGAQAGKEFRLGDSGMGYYRVVSRNPVVPAGATAMTEDAQTPPPNNQEGPDDGPTDLPADNDWMDLSWARRRSSTLSDFFDPKNIALFKIRRDQKVFDQQCDAARRHTVLFSARAQHRKGMRVDSEDGMIYRHHGQMPVGAFTFTPDKREDYGSGVFLPGPAEIKANNAERVRAERVRLAAERIREDVELPRGPKGPSEYGGLLGTAVKAVEEKSEGQWRARRSGKTPCPNVVNGTISLATAQRLETDEAEQKKTAAAAAAAADARRIDHLLSMDVEFRHAVTARAAQHAFDSIPETSLEGLDLKKPKHADPNLSSWLLHGVVTGSAAERAASDASALMKEREEHFEWLRENGGVQTADRMKWGQRLGKFNRFREAQYHSAVCDELEDAIEREDYGSFKKCMARLGKRKSKPNKMAEGSYDEHGVFTSYEGDMTKLNEGNRRYLESHFAADEYEADRPAWPELSTTRKDRERIGPAAGELLTVYRACDRGKAFGADGLPKEAYEESPEALNDFLEIVEASIFQEQVCDWMMMVMFVLLYKGKGDVNDPSRHRAIGLMTFVLKVWEGWLTMTRLKPLIANLVPQTQTAYQKGKHGVSNILWIRSAIDHVCALGRQAVLPLLDASGAFDSLSWSLIDEALAEGRADDKTRAMIRLMYTTCKGIVRTRDQKGQVTYSDLIPGFGGGVIQGGKGSPDIWLIGISYLLRKGDIARFPLSGTGERAPGLYRKRCGACRTIESEVREYQFTGMEECEAGEGDVAICHFCQSAYEEARHRGLIPSRHGHGIIAGTSDKGSDGSDDDGQVGISPGPWASNYIAYSSPAPRPRWSTTELGSDGELTISPSPAKVLDVEAEASHGSDPAVDRNAINDVVSAPISADGVDEALRSGSPYFKLGGLRRQGRELSSPDSPAVASAGRSSPRSGSVNIGSASPSARHSDPRSCIHLSPRSVATIDPQSARTVDSDDPSPQITITERRLHSRQRSSTRRQLIGVIDEQITAEDEEEEINRRLPESLSEVLHTSRGLLDVATGRARCPRLMKRSTVYAEASVGVDIGYGNSRMKPIICTFERPWGRSWMVGDSRVKAATTKTGRKSGWRHRKVPYEEGSRYDGLRRCTLVHSSYQTQKPPGWDGFNGLQAAGVQDPPGYVTDEVWSQRDEAADGLQAVEDLRRHGPFWGRFDREDWEDWHRTEAAAAAHSEVAATKGTAEGLERELAVELAAAAPDPNAEDRMAAAAQQPEDGQAVEYDSDFQRLARWFPGSTARTQTDSGDNEDDDDFGFDNGGDFDTGCVEDDEDRTARMATLILGPGRESTQPRGGGDESELTRDHTSPLRPPSQRSPKSAKRVQRLPKRWQSQRTPMSTISCIEHPAECLCWECTGIADGNRCQGVIPSESSNDNDGSYARRDNVCNFCVLGFDLCIMKYHVHCNMCLRGSSTRVCSLNMRVARGRSSCSRH